MRIGLRLRHGGVGTDAQVSRPLHVAFAIQSLHNTSGGAERVLVDVANGLHRRGLRVSVLTYQDRNGPSFYPLDFGIGRFDGRVRHSRRARAAPLATLDSASRRRPIVSAMTWLVQNMPKIWRYRQLLRVVRPDVVVAFMPSAFPYVTLAAKSRGTPVVASIHNVPERELGGDPDRWDQNLTDIWVRNKSLALVDGVTVLLPSFVEQLPPAVTVKTAVVPNMVRPYTGPVADVRTGASNVIIAVGRLATAKDHSTLIRAWASIAGRHPSWSVEIFGRGPLERDLTRLVADLGVERIVLCPPTARIYDEYVRARFLVMPSIHEGFGLVTAEAMAAGLPVIGFADCEGTNEIVIDGQNGVLVEPGDDRVAALAKSMEAFIDDESLREALGGIAPTTVDRFDPDAVLDRWEQVIGDVVHHGRPR